MSFSYSITVAPVGPIRFLIGDTNADEHFLEDEEIAWLDEQWSPQGSVYYTAAVAAETIAAELAREVAINADGQTLDLSQLQQKYLTLATTLRAQHEKFLGTGAGIYVGGIDAGAQVDNTVEPPSFGTQMHDNPMAGNQEYGDVGDRPEFRPEVGWYPV